MQCPVCRHPEASWENVDRFRLKPSGMSLCNSCGFVSYPSKYKSEDEIKAYYRKAYRPAPQASNLFTGERKLQYHAHFLTPLFEEWKKHGLTNPVVGEIGSAYGLFLNWVRQQFPEGQIYGTELTDSYRRVAFHEFGIKLEDELDKTKKYNLIASFHVLEHQLDPDIRLKEYADLLTPGGLLYVSVPIWFRDANNGAMSGYDIEYYWATDHINAWSEEHLEHIFARVGLEPVMKNTDIYGNTYLLKKVEPYAEPKTFDKAKYLKEVELLYKAWLHLQENQTALAINVWPNCPAAWSNHYELNRATLDKDFRALQDYLERAVASCPHSSDAAFFAGDVMLRYEKFEQALKYFNISLKKKPNNPTILLAIGNVYRQKAAREKDPEKKKALLKSAIEVGRFVLNISSETVPQALSWVYYDQAQLPVE
jgi:SAM-dependent methyltransferase